MSKGFHLISINLVLVSGVAVEERIPRASSFIRPDGSMGLMPLEDLYPLLPREEFLAKMIVDPLPYE
ncbi:MAG: hypothetical protein WCF17_22220 [Terracidiphilus sp.]